MKKRKRKDTNELKVMKKFVKEFNPIFTEEMVKDMNYSDLVIEIKEIVKEMQ